MGGASFLILSITGTSSVARGMSGYIDTLMNNTMARTLTDAFPINVSFLAGYPDFFAFVIVMVLAALLSFGVKESTLLNNIFTCVNLIVIAIVLVAGAMKGNLYDFVHILVSRRVFHSYPHS